MPVLMVSLTFFVLLVRGGAHAGTVDGDLLKQGDSHERRLETKKALECYLELEKSQPDNPELLLRIARQYRHLVSDTPRVSEKLKLGNVALSYSQRAISLAPNSSDAQLSRAISYAKLLAHLPKKQQVTSSKVIKADAERAIKLDRRNDLAWHVLGRWHRIASDVGTVKRALAAVAYEALPPASIVESITCLERAVALNPNRLMHHIELGLAYAQAGRNDEARRSLTKGLGMPAREKDDEERKRAGRAVLDALN